MCGQLWTRKYAFDKRTLRLLSQQIPILAIAAHIPSREIGSLYFQETHPELLFNECSHYCELVSHADQIPRILDIAMRTAISLSGVSVIILPGDVALQEAASNRPIISIEQSKAVVCPSKQEIAKLADVLNPAEKVTILGGAGCAGAHSELIEVAGILQSPIVHGMRGKEFIEYENPYDVGMTGLLGFSSGYYAMMNSDLLLMLGTDFPYQQFYPSHAYVVQVDIRGEQIGRRTKVDLGLVGDVRETLTALIPLLNQKTDKSHHLKKSLDHYRKARKDLDSYAIGKTGQMPIHPQYVAKLIDEMASTDAIFTCDVGTPTIWAARYLHMNGKRRPARLFFTWFDGKCSATSNWSTGDLSRSSGDLPLWRRRVLYAHGRLSFINAIKAAYQSNCL